MNRTTLKLRLAKLEAVTVPKRHHTLWQAPGDDTDARIASMIESGGAAEKDLFVIIRWMEPLDAAAAS